MVKRVRFLIGFTTFAIALGSSLFPDATAQNAKQTAQIEQVTPATTRSTQGSFQGRGVAQGSAFTKGRNANVVLTIDRDSFGFELAEPPGTRARVQYRGAVTRRTNTSNANGFTLDGRVRSFNSSDNLRIINNTTGTCRIEVFDARVISSSCRTVINNSSTQFLGLEQF